MENPFSVEKPVRPAFLTVLCILTFIGSGWGLINNLFQLVMFTPERLVAQIQQITNMAGAEAQPSWFSSIIGCVTNYHNARESNLLVSSFVCRDQFDRSFHDVQAKKEWFLFIRNRTDRPVVYPADLFRLE